MDLRAYHSSQTCKAAEGQQKHSGHSDKTGVYVFSQTKSQLHLTEAPCIFLIFLFLSELSEYLSKRSEIGLNRCFRDTQVKHPI